MNYRGLNEYNVSEQAKAFRDACVDSNSVDEIRQVKSQRSADRIDMGQWEITASEWHWAVRQALEEMTEIIYKQGGDWIWNSDGELMQMPYWVETEQDARNFVNHKMQELHRENYRVIKA